MYWRIGAAAAGLVLLVPLALAAPAPEGTDADAPPETAAELGLRLSDCADHLKGRDFGLARVAARCPRIEYYVLHGRLSGTIDAKNWAKNVDAANLRALAALAASYTRDPGAPLRADALREALRDTAAAHIDTRSWWRRLLDEIQEWLARRAAEQPEDSYLARLLRSLAHIFGSRSVQVGLLAGGAIALFTLAVWGAYRWRRSLAPSVRSSRATVQPPEPAPVTWSEVVPMRLRQRYSAALDGLEARGVLARARALTPAEVARHLAGIPEFEPIAAVAPLIERIGYAGVTPAERDVEAADALLAPVTEPR